MKQLLAPILLAFVLPACAGQNRADTAVPSAPLPDVATLIEAHDAAWNAHDPDQLVSLFAQGGTLVTPMGTRVEGLAALRESFAAPGPTKQTTSQTEITGVQHFGEGYVVIDARQRLSGPGVEALGVDSACVVLVARVIDGEWKLVSARPYVPATHRGAP